MASENYYTTLGVTKTASDEEIKKAYKKLSREYHPDRNPDDERAAKKFKEIQEAYSVLGDSTKRRQYDQFGHAGPQRGPQPGPGGGYSYSTGPGSGPIDLNDLFSDGGIDLSDLFGPGMGGGPRSQQVRAIRGEDVKLEIEIPFLLAVEGGDHEFRFHRGSTTERLSVKVPPGVDTGSVVRLAGQGHPGRNGGSQGDLLLQLKVQPHPWFKRDGNNLLLDVPVTPSEAALGAKVDVPTLTEGSVVLNIPAGSSSGTKLRLRGKGVLDRKTGEKGDQLVSVKIVVPKELSPKAKELYQQLQVETPDNPRTRLW